MSQITLYHNPNCSKSRGAKEILEGRGVDFEVIEYLEDPLTVTQIEALLGEILGKGVDAAQFGFIRWIDRQQTAFGRVVQILVQFKAGHRTPQSRQTGGDKA